MNIINIIEWFLQTPSRIFIVILMGFILFSIIPGVILYIIEKKKKDKIKQQIMSLANNELEMSPEEFMNMRKTSFGGRGRPSFALSQNFAGVYILYNKTKNMYYVGQAQQILNRVNSHFTGKGNGDVYADYKYGDIFSIKMIALSKSQFNTLNELERHTIMTYDSFAKGYNKTRGNR